MQSFEIDAELFEYEDADLNSLQVLRPIDGKFDDLLTHQIPVSKIGVASREIWFEVFRQWCYLKASRILVSALRLL